MTARTPRTGFASRPAAAEAWIAGPEDATPPTTPSPPVNSARLTIDVTPHLRRRLKLAALQRGVSVADMLRELLHREYPDDRETTS
ncbi:hypothetical protein DFR49_3284 [Hephaestia caeni]|uniref:Plasmid segregation centromere-binding protein ParG n=1 Tax=Hephaestia caeni TaxID=645617 RepID=A0A397NIR7_9SPHN|nr:hypothetical protein [Hephaestia caeni]RIA37400.1 hypothetical protein DFR49_3284 [Hephaestia caeni]